MSKSLKLNLIILGITGLILAGGFYVSSISKVEARAPRLEKITNINLTGYAWSSNVGWISFSGDVVESEKINCIPEVPSTRTLACPSGTSGASITQNSVCLQGATSPAWTPTTNSNCVANCIPEVPSTRTLACPSGTTGASITQNSVCSQGATSPAWTPTTNSNCVALSSSKAITNYWVKYSSQSETAGVINESTHTITVTIPYSTNLTSLISEFITNGASVRVGSTIQISGNTLNNFTTPVTYTVVAADGTTQNYIVTVNKAPEVCRNVSSGGTSYSASVDCSSGEIMKSWSCVEIATGYTYSLPNEPGSCYWPNHNLKATAKCCK